MWSWTDSVRPGFRPLRYGLQKEKRLQKSSLLRPTPSETNEQENKKKSTLEGFVMLASSVTGFYFLKLADVARFARCMQGPLEPGQCHRFIKRHEEIVRPGEGTLVPLETPKDISHLRVFNPDAQAIDQVNEFSRGTMIVSPLVIEIYRNSSASPNPRSQCAKRSCGGFFFLKSFWV